MMSKKNSVTIQFSDDFEAVDAELTAAMTALDGTNARIGELLAAEAPPAPEVAGAESAEPGPTPELPVPAEE